MHDISQFTENCHHTQPVMTFHVFVVDIIMFTKRFVVSRHCIFYMNVYYVSRELPLSLLGLVGAMLGHGWHTVR